MAPSVSPRRPADLPALLALLQRTHDEDGYPVRAAAVSAEWLAVADELDGAVAVAGGRVVGHVALHLPDDPDETGAVARWQRATGRGLDGLAVVARLFTDRSVPGSGSALLAHAVARAAELERVAVLLVDPESPAREFYRRRGWRQVGSAVQSWGHRTVAAALLVPGGAVPTGSPVGPPAG